MDSNLGWSKGGGSSSYQSWMWKRGAGFDVVTYNGNGVTGRQMPHSLGVTPEMMWVKRRNANEHWYVYHKGVNGGTNPADYMLYLDGNNAQMSHNPAWAGTVPTSTHFTLGADTAVNSGGTTLYMAMLFASVEGISKVGYYTGSNGSASPGQVAQTITTGFSPRFIIVKRVDSTAGWGWNLHDTTRGIDNRLRLQTSAAQATLAAFDLSSTGFRVTTNSGSYNASSGRYIYYAHA